MTKSSKKKYGRGRSPGSRSTHFSSKRQPARSRRKPKIAPEAAELMHKAIYEKVSGTKNGRKVKILFIEAFIQSMRKNALAAKIGEQIKYLIQLKNLGVFDFEEYKERLFRGMKNYYRKVVHSYGEMADFQEELGEAYRRSHLLYIFYFIAFATARKNCTCGACDHGLDHAEFMTRVLLKAIFDPDDEEDDEEDVDEEDVDEEDFDEEEPLDDCETD